MTELAVASHSLTKRYGRDVLAVDRVDLRVAPTEIYGLLGLNGAGKSTMIRLLLGMISPTGGSAELFGRPVRAEAPELWRRVGHLVESATAYPELTVRENLELARRMQGVGRERVSTVVELLGLTEYAERRARHLSLGNLQRLGLARALLHEPELLILDEPANGLDPAGVVEVRELLAGLARQRGVTILVSSHILAEVDLLATRIGIIHRGRLIEELDAETLARHRDPRLEICVADPGRAAAVLSAAGYHPNAAADDAGTLELRDAAAIETPEQVARVLVEGDQPPAHLALARETLEDHFLRLTRDDDATRAAA